MSPASPHIPAPGPRPHMSLCAAHMSLPAGARSTRPRHQEPQSDTTAEDVSLPPVTRVTQHFRFGLRVRARRANPKSYVTHVTRQTRQ